MDKHYNEYVQIGLNIMRCRKEAGYTQMELAEMTGYSHQHIQRAAGDGAGRHTMPDQCRNGGTGIKRRL